MENENKESYEVPNNQVFSFQYPVFRILMAMKQNPFLVLSCLLRDLLHDMTLITNLLHSDAVMAKRYCFHVKKVIKNVAIEKVITTILCPH